MFLFLRILFTILSAICVAAVIPIGSYLSFTWAIVCALAAFMFYLFMLICKQKQETQESTAQNEKSANEEEIEEKP